MDLKLEVYEVGEDGKGPVMPKEGELKLVLAWTTSMPSPSARHFWTFASYKDGKWIESNGTDLTPAPDDCLVDCWCELPTLDDIRRPKKEKP